MVQAGKPTTDSDQGHIVMMGKSMTVLKQRNL